MTEDQRERLTKLETNYEHLTKKVDLMAVQVNDVHELMLKAKGAKWAIIGLATLGGFLSAKLGAVFSLFGFFPSK